MLILFDIAQSKCFKTIVLKFKFILQQIVNLITIFQTALYYFSIFMSFHVNQLRIVIDFIKTPN